ncbi:MAG: hypothetical protein HZB26_13920 [Candidatus Hydrogenedentes bacterium]|nr:hypothetical protein [Candidatus Hydrogenedentota bacterium]
MYTGIRVRVLPAILSLAALSTAAGWGEDSAPAQLPGKVVEIARGHSWVSPYWGYNTPKIVCDDAKYFTAGLWGDKPETAEGVVYAYDGKSWRDAAHLPGIYQPATLAIDSAGRLIVAYTRSGMPVRITRSKTPGNPDDFEDLPFPGDMTNAYYIGIAIHADTLFLAYISTPDYTMYLARLDLKELTWSPSFVMRKGQVSQSPKTAWTYPILWPTDQGLHVVASNAPDGGDGNTYNEIWYQFYPNSASKPSIEEKAAESTVGNFAFAMDAVVDDAGAPHILHMWNAHKYGAMPAPDAPAPGTYHTYRDAASGKWNHIKLADTGYAGFYVQGKKLYAVLQQNGTLALREWQGPASGWKALPPLCDAKAMPAASSFMDVISVSSGSKPRGFAVVSDGLLPAVKDEPQVRVLWAVLPAD